VTPATVTVEVTGPALDAAEDEVTAETAGTEVLVDVVGNDTGSGLTVTGVTQPDEGGVVDLVEDGVRFTPEAGFRGTVTFTYTVTDVVDATATATVTVHVPNSAPVVATPALRTVTAGGSTTFTLDASDPDPDDTELLVVPDTADGSAGAEDAVLTTVGVDGSGRPTVRVVVSVTFSGTADIPVTVEDGHDDGISGTTLHLRVVPRAPVGVSAGAAPNPDARTAVSTPQFDRWGWPVARQLSTRIDSRITWRPSATTSVTQYVVRVDGVVVCTVTAPALASTLSCTLNDRVVRSTALVTVTAIGRAGTQAVGTVPVATATSAPTRLLAVVYFPAGRFALDTTAQKVLVRTDALAVKYGLRTVVLVGHTDWDGTDSANQTLSQRRAEQVGAWMTSHDKRVGVRTSGRGESQPAVSNKTYSGKAANRRVEIWVGG
jgi:outer membrane protein OmpA-like peptidoglycan-associated protein